MLIAFSKLQLDTDLLILPVFANQKITNFNIPKNAWADFQNTLGATHLIYSATDSKRMLLVGLGEKQKFQIADIRTALHSAVTIAKNLKIETATLILPAVRSSALEQLIELVGFALTFSNYQFEEYKTEAKGGGLKEVFVTCGPSHKLNQALERGMIIGKAANEARSLANHPGNIATPSHLAQHAVELAKRYKFSCKVLGLDEIKKENMGLLLGVARGSGESPKFIILEYGPKTKPVIALVGKGLTFDSGGISIKPAEHMEEMKYDMCGGADVLGIFEAVASLKLPVHLVGLIPSAENLVSGMAVKPGDILVAHDRSSVEIINTDAEGRLILADAISFAQKYYQPKLIIDLATLTGAIVSALGDEVTGYFSNTPKYDRAFTVASINTAEKFWCMPLTANYNEQLKSMFADIKNIGEKNSGGAITAGLFLQHFVKNTDWIHLDIAGTAWTMRPKSLFSPGATGWGVYLITEFLRKW